MIKIWKSHHINFLAYILFTDKKTLYQENLMKKPCNKYLSTGSCPFGDNCKYRHLRPDELEKLKYEIGKHNLL